MKGPLTFLKLTFGLLTTAMILVDQCQSVQYFWYPVQVTTLSANPTSYLRRTPGQSVHFQVKNTQDGSYHFGYDADTPRDKSYREERRDAYGRVTGSYGYLDPEGTLRVVDYVADEGGFRTQIRNQVPVYVEPQEAIQVIGPIPKPFSQFFKV